MTWMSQRSKPLPASTTQSGNSSFVSFIKGSFQILLPDKCHEGWLYLSMASNIPVPHLGLFYHTVHIGMGTMAFKDLKLKFPKATKLPPLPVLTTFSSSDKLANHILVSIFDLELDLQTIFAMPETVFPSAAVNIAVDVLCTSNDTDSYKHHYPNGVLDTSHLRVLVLCSKW